MSDSLRVTGEGTLEQDGVNSNSPHGAATVVADLEDNVGESGAWCSREGRCRLPVTCVPRDSPATFEHGPHPPHAARADDLRTGSAVTTPSVRAHLDLALRTPAAHVERLSLVAAAISEALRQRGMRATLVGGGAIEFHASSIYTTTDIDLVVEGGTRDQIDEVLRDLGFVRRGRHWVRDDLFVEVPGNRMSDPVDVMQVGDYELRVICREIVLADRIIGFKHWRATIYGAQALAMLTIFGDSLNEPVLRARLREEDAEDALHALRALSARGGPVNDALLRQVIARLHGEEDTTQRRESDHA